MAQAVPVDPDDPLIEEHSGYGAPAWLKIPAIDLDSPVEPVGIADGHYQTARFRVGHHEDSVPPGAIGNSVLNGHVTSLTDGRVFVRLHELTTGDTFSVYSDSHVTEWEVVAAGWMPADEDWYVQPTRDIRVTLYTCGGNFDFTRLDYSHRYVVVAGLVRVEPLSEDDETAGPVE